jgi:hypothetical protein
VISWILEWVHMISLDFKVILWDSHGILMVEFVRS